MSVEPCCNIKNKPIHVNHSELERFSPMSCYKSLCPVCNEGLLLLARHQDTMVLKADDRCTFCGQSVFYDDIETLRKRERGER